MADQSPINLPPAGGATFGTPPDAAQPEATGGIGAEISGGGGGGPPWSQLWQMPVLLAGVALLCVWGYLLFYSAHPKNDFDGALNSVGQYIKANNFEGARSKINEVLKYGKDMTPAQEARLKQTWGDLIYLEQRAAGEDVAENHTKIIELYTEAKKLGQAFDAQHWQRWAATLVALGKEDEAIKLMSELKGQPAEMRCSVLREIIERRRRQPGATLQALAPLFTRFQDELRGEEPAQRRPQELWLAALRAQMMLDGDEPEQAVDELLRRINMLAGSDGESDLSPLMVLLGKAYQRTGENAKARAWYLRAQSKLPVADAAHADILVGLGQIELADANNPNAALEDFTAAMAQYPPSVPAYFDALLGRADCEARLGAQPEAIEHFDKAVRFVLDQSLNRESRQKRLYDTIHTHFDAATERADPEMALEYLDLLPPLYQRQTELPSRLLLEFATTHEKIAEHANALRAAAAATQPSRPGIPEVSKTPEEKHQAQQAALHMGRAAEFYLRHAHAVMVSDEAAYASSLWSAAESFDKAQLWKSSIDAYTEYVKNRGGDPRQMEALLQLGLAYEADGQFIPAIDRLKQVIEIQPNTPLGYGALVPLARCYEATNDNDSAKRVLAFVVKDHPTITPVSEVYRDALIELGKLHYKLGEYKEAIERLQLAVDRYKDSADADEVRYRLADAYRRSIEDLDKDLLEPMPQSKKVALEGERARRLDEAQVLFSQVISGMEARPEHVPTPLEELFYRNAYFYRADCAYDLRRFEQAIQLYDLAAKRFENQPASLVALIQIVNAYCELGRTQEAKVANLRARSLLKRIPDDAFKDPSLPMTRAHWEDWLRWTSELDLFKSQASVGQ